MKVDEQVIRRTLVHAYKGLKSDGLIYGSAGNISIRQDDFIWITPSGIRPEELLPEHICSVHIDGTVRTSASAFAPSSEVPLHLEVYRHTSASAVVHGHSTHAVSVGLVTEELPNVHYVMRRFGGSVAVVPYSVFGSEELARDVSNALRSRSAALLQNHGAVTFGSELGDALESYRILEWVCGIYLKARRIGEPVTLSQEQLEEVATAARTKGYRL